MSRSSTALPQWRVTYIQHLYFSDPEFDDRIQLTSTVSNLISALVLPTNDPDYKDVQKKRVLKGSTSVNELYHLGMAPISVAPEEAKDLPRRWKVTIPLYMQRLNDTADLTMLSTNLALIWQAFLYRKLLCLQESGVIPRTAHARTIFLGQVIKLPKFPIIIDESHFRVPDKVTAAWRFRPKEHTNVSEEDYADILCALTMIFSGLDTVGCTDHIMASDLAVLTDYTWGPEPGLTGAGDRPTFEFHRVLSALMNRIYMSGVIDVKTLNKESLWSYGIDYSRLPGVEVDPNETEWEGDDVDDVDDDDDTPLAWSRPGAMNAIRARRNGQ